MKKLRRLIVTIMCCVFVMGMCVYAGTYQGDGYTLEYAIDGSNATITKYHLEERIFGNGIMIDLVIPDTIDGYRVTKIGTKVFKGGLIKSITIPDTVTSIGNYAFSACL